LLEIARMARREFSSMWLSHVTARSAACFEASRKGRIQMPQNSFPPQ